MDIKYFEKWDLEQDDFTIDTYKTVIFDNECKWGVTVGIRPYSILVSCHSKNSQVRNKEECLKILYIILTNYKV